MSNSFQDSTESIATETEYPEEEFEKYYNILIKLVSSIDSCPKCYNRVYDGKYWILGHLPYIHLSTGEVELGYVCPEASTPIILYKVKRRMLGETEVYE
ncbi:MAG: hypothetical protein DRJ52_06410 [Thermoprotei archaeon]|nr:MAG: hypothetical protein DRJ52_06410 [Thermoprotei archaeon]RLE99154.1 MAG: hypothetical protein DRJ63_06215 [Thermoprotei archaeon]